MLDISAYFNTLNMFGIRLGLEATEELACKAGNPHKRLRFIHIAGTNGKGSVAAMLECALRHCGLKTGLYTSPHLVDVRERFRINGKAVAKDLLDRAGTELTELAGEAKYSYFEFATVLAMKLFAEAKVDIVIWETGMGGRLDATNIVTPLVSVITNIAMDHQAYLGNTPGKIAAEKAGILKPGKPLFHGVLPPEADTVIRARAANLGCRVISPRAAIPEQYSMQKVNGRNCQCFLYDDRLIKLALPGRMQRENFRIVYEILDFLQESQGIDIERGLDALVTVKWPARFQLIDGRIILDGGHNPDGIQALTTAVEEIFPGQKLPVLFAAFGDKEVFASIAILRRIAAKFYFTTPGAQSRLPHSPDELRQFAGPDIDCVAEENNHRALELLLTENRGPVIISGSLYFAGEILRTLCPPEEYLNL